jgi:hypothetical protein
MNLSLISQYPTVPVRFGTQEESKASQEDKTAKESKPSLPNLHFLEPSAVTTCLLTSSIIGGKVSIDNINSGHYLLGAGLGIASATVARISAKFLKHIFTHRTF